MDSILYMILFLTILLGICVPLYIWNMNHPRAPKQNKKKRQIACVGDSITYGSGVLGKRKKYSYPALLQSYLPEEYHVLNFGLSGRTLISSGDKPYCKETFYLDTFRYKPDFYIVMLGTNDAKLYNWDAVLFKEELWRFLKKYVSSVGNKNVICMIPPKAFVLESEQEPKFDILNENILEQIPIVQEIGKELQISIINLYDYTKDHPEWFCDGIHPNKEGNEAIAHMVKTVILSGGRYE